MKRFFIFCFATLLASAPSFAQTEVPPSTDNALQSTKIQWYTSIKDAKVKAKEEMLPLYVCFTGTSWCFWCQRLEKEIQSSPDFIQKVHDKFIFVRIDIPKEQTDADPEIRDLMMKYEVYGVPVILLLTPSLEKLGQLSYQTISPQDFADLALTIGYPKAI